MNRHKPFFQPEIEVLVHSMERLPTNESLAASRMTLTYTGLQYLCRAVQYCLRVCAAVLIGTRRSNKNMLVRTLTFSGINYVIWKTTLVWEQLSALINKTLCNYLLLNVLNGSILCPSFEQWHSQRVRSEVKKAVLNTVVMKTKEVLSNSFVFQNWFLLV